MLSLVIPAYNEAGAIVGVVEGFLSVLEELPTETELIVVDDHSADGTADLVTGMDGVQVVRNPRNLGYGHSLLRGIQVARGEYLAIADGDGSYPADALAELWALVQQGADHSIGSREGHHLTSHFGMRRIYRWLCYLVTGEAVSDANCGLRIFDRRLIDSLRGDLCTGFSFTTSLTIASIMSGYVVVFHPISYLRREGQSHVRRFRDTLRTAQYLVQLVAVYNPIKLFLPLIMASAGGCVAALVYAAVASSPWAALTCALFAATTLLLVALAVLAYVASRTGRNREAP